MMHTKPKIALVYDWVNTQYGGAEQVILCLHKLYPDAPLYTSLKDLKRAKWAKTITIFTSPLQYLPFAPKFHRELMILMPAAFGWFDFSKYDIVISITSAEAKGIRVPKQVLHICYLLTPTRYLWSHTHEYQTGLLKPIKALLFSLMRQWDFSAAQQPDVMIPISQIVKKRAQKYYRRQIEPVIYPPSNTKLILPSALPEIGKYFLVVSRLVEYKKIELAIQACIKTHQHLLIIGDGPQKKLLYKEAQKLDPHHSFIRFYSSVSNQKLSTIFTFARALILSSEEDFGLVALEAQSFGIPVIVYQKSGAAEVVKNLQTGVHVSNMSCEAFADAISKANKIHWQKRAIQKHAKQYNEQVFLKKFAQEVKNQYQKHVKRTSLLLPERTV